MTKENAIREINVVVNTRIIRLLKCSEAMQEELCTELDLHLSDEKIENYQLLEMANGFYLGEIENGQYNGYGIYMRYEGTNTNSLYMGGWCNNKRNGEGLYFRSSGECYSGGFVNDFYQGEQSLLVKDGVEIEADFFNGEICKVRYSSEPITVNIKKSGNERMTEAKNRSKKSGCSGWISLVFIILLGLGIYSYCSAWWETQKPSSQTELYGATTTYICTARQSLKVRTSPSTSSSQIGSIMSGEEVEVYEISNGFAKIQYNGNIGYASTKYLKRK